MIPLTEAERAVYYPADRRFSVWIRPSALVVIAALVLVPLSLAWLEARLWGLPAIALNPAAVVGAATGPHGFPAWIRWCHFFNLFFTFMLIRSGLSILMDHPRLYFNDGCTPGSEWIRFTPLKVPKTACGQRKTITVTSLRSSAFPDTATPSASGDVGISSMSTASY